MTFKLLSNFRYQSSARCILTGITATLLLMGMGATEARSPRRTPTNRVNAEEAAKYRWRVFTPADGSFSVLMPGEPKATSQSQKTFMGEINLNLFIAQPPKQEVAYIVAYNDFPNSYGKMADPQEVLTNAQEMALKTTQGKIISQRAIQSNNGHPGRELEYVNPGGKITKNRMFFAQGRLYQIMVITTPRQKRFLGKSIPGYLNSFQIVLRR